MICSKCGEEKELDCFHKDKKSKTGYRKDCKECAIERGRKLYFSEQKLEERKKKREENREQKKQEGLFVLENQKCLECGEVKNIDYFHENCNSKIGYIRVCKECYYKLHIDKNNKAEIIKKREEKKIQKEEIKKQREKGNKEKEELFADGKIECKQCSEIKDLDCFSKSKEYKNGYSSFCKDCKRWKYIDEGTREGRKLVREQRKEQWDLFGQNKKRCNECSEVKDLCEFAVNKANKGGYDSKCKECRSKIRQSENYQENYKRYCKRDYVIQKELERRTTEEFKKMKSLSGKKYRQTEEGKIKRREAHRRDRKTHKLKYNFSSAISKSLKSAGGKKHRHWEDLVGYTLEELKNHLEKQFLPGMNWGNHTLKGWHIDHIIPQSFFEFKDYDDTEFKMCWALNNLQPLWWYDNLTKHTEIKIKEEKVLSSQKL